MMTQAHAPVIERWFASVGGASLVLPDGWFGRPYDNLHQLTFATDRPLMTLIELDEQLLMVFINLREVVEEEDSDELRLVPRGFDQLVIARVEYGGTTPHSGAYSRGSVQFVGPVVGSVYSAQGTLRNG